MASAAVGDAEREQVDTRVPPPRLAARRWWTGPALALAVVATILASLSGLLGPRLAWVPDGGWEASGPHDDRVSALRHITIRNEGWLPVRLRAFEQPDRAGLEWGQVTGVPATIPPGAQHEITVPFTVRSCGIDLAGFNALPLRVSSGLAPARVVGLAAPYNDPPNDRGQVDDDQTPPWPDQPPSWILDTIRANCVAPPHE